MRLRSVFKGKEHDKASVFDDLRVRTGWTARNKPCMTVSFEWGQM